MARRVRHGWRQDCTGETKVIVPGWVIRPSADVGDAIRHEPASRERACLRLRTGARRAVALRKPIKSRQRRAGVRYG